MLKEMNLEIDRKCFGSLILDYEFEDFVKCRVLIDGWYKATIYAKNREEAIKLFREGNY